MTDETVSGRKRYDKVNATWPAIIPTLTGPEAVTAAKRLYRFGTGHVLKHPVRLTSGNRHTWIKRGTLRINPEQGWRALVHSISHLAHWHKNPNRTSHDFRHEFLEGEMVAYVLEHGWLDGKLQRPVRKPKPPVQEVRYQRILRQLAAWKTKQKRAATAIRKLEKRKRRYEKKQA